MDAPRAPGRSDRVADRSSGASGRDDTRRLACVKSPREGSRGALRAACRVRARDDEPVTSAVGREAEATSRPGSRRATQAGPGLRRQRHPGPRRCRSGQVAILEQEEREQQRCSTVQHAIAQCRKNVADPGDHRPGRDRRAGVEELQRRQDPGEQPGHEADQLVDTALRSSPRPGPG